MDNQLLINLINKSLSKIKVEINSQINQILKNLSNYVEKDGDKTLTDNNFSDNYKEILDKFVANGIEVDNIIDKDELTNILSGYIKQTSLEEILNQYSTTNDIEELLKSYIKIEAFHKYLVEDEKLFEYLHNSPTSETDSGLGFITAEEVNTLIDGVITGDLTNYVKTNDLNNILLQYIKNEDINTKLQDYATTQYVDNKLQDIDVSDKLNDYATLEYVNNELNNKVSSVEGKDLSSNDFEDKYKSLLDKFTISDDGTLLFNGVSIGSIGIDIVSTLPTENISKSTIYFVPGTNPQNPDNIYTEYMYVNNKWEIFGQYDISKIDLSEYVKKTELDKYALKESLESSNNEINKNTKDIETVKNDLNDFKLEYAEAQYSSIKLTNTYNEW